ncbi:hypothetical protein PPACK8108_LOCUS19375 [Phakopsora pachyrhizi]|uniref:Secreted protein n=1 Tax=Phakopsora pachyrhizi TaxID=170000 RepID=A0AAV0BFX5_PHAPC|nr:hypothetical protein PPACK8108_LOCUS19375 [Phakopsora pachyrhizi]
MKKLWANKFLLLLFLLAKYVQAGEETIDFLARFSTQIKPARERSISIPQARFFSEGSKQDWLKLGVMAEDKEPDHKRLKIAREIDFFSLAIERENSEGFPSVRSLVENVYQGQQSIVQPQSTTRDDLRLVLADTHLNLQQLATSSNMVEKNEAQEFTTYRHIADTSAEASSTRIDTSAMRSPAARVSARYPKYRNDIIEHAEPPAQEVWRKKKGFSRHNPIFLDSKINANLLTEMISIGDHNFQISDESKSTLKGISKNNEPSKNNAEKEQYLPLSSATQNIQGPKATLNKASTGPENQISDTNLKSSKITVVNNSYLQKERATDSPSNIELSEKRTSPAGSSSAKYIKTTKIKKTENKSTAFSIAVSNFVDLKTEKSTQFELKKSFEEEFIRLIDPQTEFYSSIFGSITVNEFGVYNLETKGSSELIELSKSRDNIEAIVARFNDILHSTKPLLPRNNIQPAHKFHLKHNF